MQTALLIGLVFVIILLIWVILELRKKGDDKHNDGVEKEIARIQGQLEQLPEINKTLDRKLSETSRVQESQLSKSVEIVQSVTEKLTELGNTNKQVLQYSEQLQKLQEILKNPKQRGVLGEYYLGTLLKKAFQPGQYKLQYKFNDGLIVDAVLIFGDKLIPIDSKFSLENYNRIAEESDETERKKLEELFKRDLKNRIDETAKYIRPQEGTLDFAFMFIPAEGIYYDLLINKVGTIKANTRALLEYATHEKSVHIVSPTTFYVTLQSLMVGLNAFKIQESTKQIVDNISVLGKHLKAYSEYHQKLGKHLSTSVGMYEKSSTEFGKIDKDVLKITGDKIGFEQQQLNKPHQTDED
ncbi:DNA recombination protein RmuC [Patescibacteria group bacterium]